MKKSIALSLIGLMFSVSTNANGFVPQEIINQFGQMNINGLTAQQIAIDARTSTFTEARRQAEVAKQDAIYQRLKDNFEAANYRERSYRTIRGRDTVDYYSDPYDFFGGYGTYVHTLSFSDCNLTCVHGSIEGVNNHADAFIARRNAYRALDEYNNDIKNNRIEARINKRLWELYGAEYDKKIADGLAPFKQKIIDQYKPDYDLINSASDGIKCQAITEIQKKNSPAIAVIPAFSYKHRVRCQDSQTHHQFDVYENESGFMQIGCTCGHATSEHEPNFRPGNIQAKKVFLKHYDETKSQGTKESSYIKKLRSEIAKAK